MVASQPSTDPANISAIRMALRDHHYWNKLWKPDGEENSGFSQWVGPVRIMDEWRGLCTPHMHMIKTRLGPSFRAAANSWARVPNLHPLVSWSSKCGAVMAHNQTPTVTRITSGLGRNKRVDQHMPGPSPDYIGAVLSQPSLASRSWVSPVIGHGPLRQVPGRCRNSERGPQRVVTVMPLSPRASWCAGHDSEMVACASPSQSVSEKINPWSSRQVVLAGCHWFH